MNRGRLYLLHNVSALAALLAMTVAMPAMAYRNPMANRPTARRKRWAKSHTPQASRLIRRAFGRSQPC